MAGTNVASANVELRFIDQFTEGLNAARREVARAQQELGAGPSGVQNAEAQRRQQQEQQEQAFQRRLTQIHGSAWRENEIRTRQGLRAQAEARRQAQRQMAYDHASAINMEAAREQRHLNHMNRLHIQAHAENARRARMGRSAGSAGSAGIFGGIGSVGGLGGLAATAGAMFSTNEIIAAMKEIEGLEGAFRGMSDSAEEAAGHLQYVRRSAQDMGLLFVDVAQGYKQLQAAAKITGFTVTETRNLTNALQRAGVALRLESTSIKRAFMALTQMLSKGRIMSEEVRLQFGEHIPGAMQIFANAAGISVQAMSDLMENGLLPTLPVLRGIPAALEEAFTMPRDAAEGMIAATNQMTNAWTELKATIGDTGPLKSGVKVLTALMKDLNRATTWVGSVIGAAPYQRTMQPLSEKDFISRKHGSSLLRPFRPDAMQKGWDVTFTRDELAKLAAARDRIIARQGKSMSHRVEIEVRRRKLALLEPFKGGMYPEEKRDVQKQLKMYDGEQGEKTRKSIEADLLSAERQDYETIGLITQSFGGQRIAFKEGPDIYELEQEWLAKQSGIRNEERKKGQAELQKIQDAQLEKETGKSKARIAALQDPQARFKREIVRRGEVYDKALTALEKKEGVSEVLKAKRRLFLGLEFEAEVAEIEVRAEKSLKGKKRKRLQALKAQEAVKVRAMRAERMEKKRAVVQASAHARAMQTMERNVLKLASRSSDLPQEERDYKEGIGQARSQRLVRKEAALRRYQSNVLSGTDPATAERWKRQELAMARQEEQASEELSRIEYEKAIEKRSQKAEGLLERFKGKVKSHSEIMGDALEGAFERAGNAVSNFVMTGEFDLKQFARRMAADYAGQLALNVLKSTIGSVSDTIAARSGKGVLVSGARAAGGPVQKGLTYLVGERGPELFTAKKNGHIIPSESMQGGSTVNVTFKVDAVDGASVQRMLIEQKSTITGIINEAVRRNGQRLAVI